MTCSKMQRLYVVNHLQSDVITLRRAVGFSSERAQRDPARPERSERPVRADRAVSASPLPQPVRAADADHQEDAQPHLRRVV